MLLAHSHKFIFLHVPKTGGQSIHKAVEPYMDGRDEFGAPKRHEKYYHHATPDVLLEYTDREVWDSYFKFVFVRNPWDRILSQYFFFKTKDTMLKFNPNWHREFGEKYKDFNDWLKKTPKHNWFQPATDWIFNNGRMEVDFVGRFEHFYRDFKRACSVIGLPKSTTLPQVNKTVHDHYSTYYNDESVEIIREQFSKDIEMFGYEFKRMTIL